MILSLATTAALTGVVGGRLNSSFPFDPFDPSWILGGDDPANSSSSSSDDNDQGVVVVRTLTPDLLPDPVPDPLLQELNPWDVALCVTGTLVACENALVLAVLVYTPALRAPMFVLMGSLAAADLLAGLGLVLHFALAYLAPPGGALELLSAGVLIAAFSASVLSVLAITVDRYRSLYNALTYHAERTLTCTYAMVALTWASCVALGALPALGWNCLEADASSPASCSVCRPVAKGNAVALAAGLLLVLALMTQLHLQICRVALRHAQQIAGQRQLSRSSSSAAAAVAVATGGSSSTKGVSTLSAILCAFGACWLPLATYAMVADGSWPPAYAYAAALPAACCSAINPVVYAFRHPDVQKSLWAACCGGGRGRDRGGGRGGGCGCGCVPSGLSLRPRNSSDV